MTDQRFRMLKSDAQRRTVQSSAVRAVEEERDRVDTRRDTVIGFVAGAVGVLTVHQAMVWLLHDMGFAPWEAYRLTPTRPFGIPALFSAAFWGGAWSILIYRVAKHQASRRSAWLAAIGSAALFPTILGGVLIALHFTARLEHTPPLRALIASIVINGCWGASILAIGDSIGGWWRRRSLDARRPNANI